MVERRRLILFCFLLVGLLGEACVFQGCIYVSGKGLLGMRPGPLKETLITGSGKDKILLVDLNGIISEEERGGIFRLKPEPSMVATVIEQLEKASNDKRMKGILLQINSPGGTVTASDILYHEIKKFKEERNVKVVAMLMGTAASGAYYVAQAADTIVAHPTSVTGSIGVILININLGGLFDKIGVSDQSIKSGTYKDLGSPLRKPEKGEREILQAVVDELNNQFRAVVEKRRPNLKLKDHPELADGRIFTAQQALEAGLVDQIGYFDEAFGLIKKEAGISNARLIRYISPDEYRPNIYARMQEAPPQEINLFKVDLESLRVGRGPTFMYLWLPGS